MMVTMWNVALSKQISYSIYANTVESMTVGVDMSTLKQIKMFL